MSNNNSLNKYQNIINYKDYEDNRKKNDLIKVKNPFEKSNFNESISQEKYISHSNSSLSRESKSIKSVHDERKEINQNLVNNNNNDFVNNKIRMEYKPLSIRENFNLFFQLNQNKEESKILTTNSSLIKDDNYLKIINEIYKKRKIMNNTEKNNQDNSTNFSNKNLYENQINYMKNRDKKLLQLKNNILKKENLDYTFSPKIFNENRKKKINQNEIKQFFKRNMEWKNKINIENKNKFKEKLKEDKKIYTFYPKTNEEVHSKVLESILENKNKKDYIYRNNLKWLNRKNDLIKEEEKNNFLKMRKKKDIKDYNTKNKNEKKIIIDLKKLENNEKQKNKIEINKEKNYKIKNKNINKNLNINNHMNNDINLLKDMINDLKKTIDLNKKFIKETKNENKNEQK